MRLVHVCDRWTDRGGAPAYLAGVLEALSESQVQQLLFAGTAEAGLADPSVPLRIWPGLEDPRGASPGLLEAIARERPDVVHVHNLVNPEQLEALRPLDPVVTVQDHRFFCPSRGKWTREGRPCDVALSPESCAPCFEDARYFAEVHEVTVARLRALRGLRVGVLSAYMKAELVAAGVAADEVFVTPPWPHGLDPGALPAGPPCVLFAGRLVEAKGVRDAVAAWRRARLDLPLLFAGTGPLRTELERDGFEVTGWLPHRAMAAIYRRAQALVMPSRWQEPFGIAGLEALSLGVPVAAWDSGGVREWHPGPGLVAWGDVDGLASALRGVAGQPAGPAPGFSRDRGLEALFHMYGARRPGSIRRCSKPPSPSR
jgi:glycosyltransferase involved in cell wall biosynthesis